MVMSILVNFLILLTSLPIGFLLCWLCGDELVKDRRYFIFFMYFIVLVLLLLGIFYFNIPMMLSLIYLLIILGIFVIAGRRTSLKAKVKK
ncbi:MAG: hypothetical protein Q8L27_00610 [archaeon]|nr:hypothetical protein [archaeon]